MNKLRYKTGMLLINVALRIIGEKQDKDVYKGRDWSSQDDMWPEVTQVKVEPLVKGYDKH